MLGREVSEMKNLTGRLLQGLDAVWVGCGQDSFYHALAVQLHNAGITRPVGSTGSTGSVGPKGYDYTAATSGVTFPAHLSSRISSVHSYAVISYDAVHVLYPSREIDLGLCASTSPGALVSPYNLQREIQGREGTTLTLLSGQGI